MNNGYNLHRILVHRMQVAPRPSECTTMDTRAFRTAHVGLLFVLFAVSARIEARHQIDFGRPLRICTGRWRASVGSARHNGEVGKAGNGRGSGEQAVVRDTDLGLATTLSLLLTSG